MSHSNKNKLLAKNTVLLYFRMVLLMFITLYTSRVTLQVLGINDFGVYNIVGGVVVLFAFLSNSLNSACNRFFSVSLAKNDEDDIQKTFSTALVAFIVLTIVVLLLLETVGYWFIINKVNLPDNRIQDGIIVYHVVVLSVCLNIMRTPFNSSIIANEKMGFYAYISIVEGLLKLVIVWVLILIPFDKLISYSVLVCISILIINGGYVWYCVSNFRGNNLILKYDKQKLKDILTFSGWNMFGGIADIGWQQGTNIILNHFYGVSLNAAMGITNQIRSAIYSFVGNLQIAANPQIYKSYANSDLTHYYSLILSISKCSYYLMLFFSIPLILNMDFILQIWLNNVPPHTTSFSILILIFSLVSSLGGPLWAANQATGDVKTYSVIVSCILLLNLPLTYFFLKGGDAPEYMLYTRILIATIQLICSLLYTCRKVNLSLRLYFSEVFVPVIVVSFLSFFLSYNISKLVESGWIRFFTTSTTGVVILICVIWIFGINTNERSFVYGIIKKIFKYKNNSVN